MGQTGSTEGPHAADQSRHAPEPAYCTPSRLQLFGLTAVVACVGSIFAVGALAIARPDLSISSDPISEYVHGRFSYVQIVVFFAVGVASAGIAGGLHCVLLPPRLSRLSAIALAIWSVGMMVAGVIDIEDQHFGTSEGAIHDITVTIAFLMLFVAAVIAARARPRPLRHRRSWPVVTGAWAVGIGVTLLLTGVADGTPWFGLAERALALVAVTWLIYLGTGLLVASPGHAAQDSRA